MLLDQARNDHTLPTDGTDVWLGARRTSTSSQFAWDSGATMGFTDWHHGQPSHHHGGHTALCLQTFRNGHSTWRWHVAGCEGSDKDNAYACEMNHPKLTEEWTRAILLKEKGNAPTDVTDLSLIHI